MLSGATTPRAGEVRVLEGDPTEPGIRQRIAYVSLEPALPESLRVDELLEVASALRRDPPAGARERLSLLGIDGLARRRVGSLSQAEARAVLLVEALTSPRVRVLLVEEPFITIDARAASTLVTAVRAYARDGRAVVVATASLRDAGELADDHVLLRAGVPVGQVASLELLAGAAPPGARVRIVTSQAQALLAELAREPGIEAIARRDGAVIARGGDAVALAQAAGRAVVASGVDVFELRLESPSMEEARAVLTEPARPPPAPSDEAR
jgi:ABC-2 type transport system ATP-binding protein